MCRSLRFGNVPATSMPPAPVFAPLKFSARFVPLYGVPPSAVSATSSLIVHDAVLVPPAAVPTRILTLPAIPVPEPATAVCTNAVVATRVELSPAVGVGPGGLPRTAASVRAGRDLLL